jgi:hypothetical protein
MAINGNQWQSPSRAPRGLVLATNGNQWQSMAINGNHLLARHVAL